MQLRNNNNASALSPNTGLDLGSVSDDWALEVSLKLGDTAAESVISAKLINVTANQSSTVGSYMGINSEVFDAATSSGILFIYGFRSIGRQWTNTNFSGCFIGYRRGDRGSTVAIGR